MDLLYGGGGDFHTTYWPQPSYLSSRKYYIESTFQSYHELDFSVEDRNTIYWHHTVPKLGVEGSVCYTCTLNILTKPTLLEIVQTLNPGQPELPEWVYNGAILGVQGGTDTMFQFGRLTQIFTTLKNYTKAAVRQNAIEHTPVMRPLFLIFDNDTESYSQDYEYMFGDDLLVAPVLEPGLTAWTVYLPGPETWVHLWGDDEVTGPISVEVEAPLGKPPVFYRKSSSWVELFVGIRNQFS